MNGLSKDAVNWVEVDAESDGQRIDNYLARLLKGVPKSHVYRILRSGEVRVDGHRAEASTRLAAGNRLRIPPIRVAARAVAQGVPATVAARPLPVLLEDEHLLAVDKSAGLAVHGGSGVSYGVIERLRAERPEARFLELVHRLDRDTSGVLLLAKKRAALTDLHAQMREGRTDKRYLALVHGRWVGGGRTLDAPLAKYVLEGGERRVEVNADGQEARTVVRPVRALDSFTLLEARLLTGRTHQIRVHLAHAGLAICGDDKYGDFSLNREMAKKGLKRMFLHAARLQFVHPATRERVSIAAPLPPELAGFIERLAEGGEVTSVGGRS
jgi:23S rRNA pseudouridine955/2504/2580 synthase